MLRKLLLWLRATADKVIDKAVSELFQIPLFIYHILKLFVDFAHTSAIIIVSVVLNAEYFSMLLTYLFNNTIIFL